MAVLGLVSGPPASGHTFSVRNMPPKETIYVDADRKGLAWAGAVKDWNAENGNYVQLSDAKQIIAQLQKISDEKPHIKYVIVDTISTIMSDAEVANMKKPGFDPWKDYAVDIYDLFAKSKKLRGDLIIFFMAHTMIINDENSNYKPQLVLKTGGKKLSKLNLNGKINYNLYTHIEHAPNGQSKYFFLTQSDGINQARSTHGVLDYKIPNDLYAVCKAIREKDLCID